MHVALFIFLFSFWKILQAPTMKQEVVKSSLAALVNINAGVSIYSS